LMRLRLLASRLVRMGSIRFEWDIRFSESWIDEKPVLQRG
jgi:hypothetical protein